MSNDLVAYEDLNVRNMVRNRHLALGISDAAWTQLRTWVEYFGKVFGVVTVAVPPHYTSQNCSNCGEIVKKSLSVRTHVCTDCGHIQDRDWNAARNILELGLRTVGHTGTSSLELENASGETDQYLGSQRRAGVPERVSGGIIPPEISHPVEATGVEATPPSKSTRGKRKPKEQSLESLPSVSAG
jgi:putative transposase